MKTIHWGAAAKSLLNWALCGGLVAILPAKYHPAVGAVAVLVQTFIPGVLHTPPVPPAP